MGKAYRLVRPQLTLEDIMRLRTDSEYSLTTSPFGITPAEYAANPPLYLKRAVAWKGKMGAEFERTAPSAVVEGLKKAIRISKACAGIKGTVLHNGKLYPRKCIEQKKKAGTLV